VILTDARPYQDVLSVCSKLGERLWGQGQGQCKRNTIAVPFAESLKYDGVVDASSKFWVSGSDSKAVDVAGRYSKVSPASSRFLGLCTNTAPFSTQSSQDTDDKWQISLDVNNQTLTG
jgi:hypothetical protein